MNESPKKLWLDPPERITFVMPEIPTLSDVDRSMTLLRTCGIGYKRIAIIHGVTAMAAFYRIQKYEIHRYADKYRKWRLDGQRGTIIDKGNFRKIATLNCPYCDRTMAIVKPATVRETGRRSEYEAFKLPFVCELCGIEFVPNSISHNQHVRQNRWCSMYCAQRAHYLKRCESRDSLKNSPAVGCRK